MRQLLFLVGFDSICFMLALNKDIHDSSDRSVQHYHLKVPSSNHSDDTFPSFHYANASMQYTAIFHGCKNGNLSLKKCYIFSSPEPLGSQGELIVYPLSRRPSVVRPSSVRPSVHHFQRSSPLKPLGQSKPNFMWSLLGKGEPKFV